MATDPKGAKGAKDGDKKGEKKESNNYFVGMTGDPDTSPDIKLRFASAFVSQLGTVLGMQLNTGFVKQVLDRVIGRSVVGAVMLTTIGESILNEPGPLRELVQALGGARSQTENELIEKLINSTVAGLNADRMRYGVLTGPRMSSLLDNKFKEFKPQFEALPKPVTFDGLCNDLNPEYRFKLAQLKYGLKSLPQARQDYWAKNSERVISKTLLLEILDFSHSATLAVDYLELMLPKAPTNVVQTAASKAVGFFRQLEAAVDREMGDPDDNDDLAEEIRATTESRIRERERR